jgi:periplasmic divalent cation tolerance protein
MISANDFRIVYVTTNSIESAAHISRIIVSEHLAACSTIIPNAISFFSWADAINERHECILMIKTVKDKIDKLFERIQELHQDEVPEIISVNIQDAYEPYLHWLNSTLTSNNNDIEK